MTDPVEPMPLRPLPPSKEEEHLAWKTIFAKRVLITLLVTVLLATLGLTAVGVVIIRTNQQDGRAVVDRINSCTTPGRACYERGQRQTARVVGDINRVTVYAAACASKMPGQSADQIQRCIVKLLAEDAPTKKARR